MLEIMSDTRHLSHSSLVNSEFGRFSLMLLESDVNYYFNLDESSNSKSKRNTYKSGVSFPLLLQV
jgi:hypothetical protein